MNKVIVAQEIWEKLRTISTEAEKRKNEALAEQVKEQSFNEPNSISTRNARYNVLLAQETWRRLKALEIEAKAEKQKALNRIGVEK